MHICVWFRRNRVIKQGCNSLKAHFHVSADLYFQGSAESQAMLVSPTDRLFVLHISKKKKWGRKTQKKEKKNQASTYCSLLSDRSSTSKAVPKLPLPNLARTR